MKTERNCDTCEIQRFCGSRISRGDFIQSCCHCKYYVSCGSGRMNFGKTCVCTLCRARGKHSEWVQRKDL